MGWIWHDSMAVKAKDWKSEAEGDKELMKNEAKNTGRFHEFEGFLSKELSRNSAKLWNLCHATKTAGESVLWRPKVAICHSDEKSFES